MNHGDSVEPVITVNAHTETKCLARLDDNMGVGLASASASLASAPAALTAAERAAKIDAMIAKMGYTPDAERQQRTRRAQTQTPKPKTPAPTSGTPAPTNASDEPGATPAFPDAYGKPGDASDTEQAGLPIAGIAKFANLAQTYVSNGIDTPTALARKFDELFDGKARKYSQAFWDLIGSAKPSLRGTHDWAAIYAALDNPVDPAPTPPPAKVENAPLSVSQLNQHPLNRAAALLLKKAGEDLDEGTPPTMHLLQLAMLPLEWENPQEQDALMLLADYASSLHNQKVALAILENSLDLDDFLSGTPQQAAEEVLNLLEPLPDRD